MDIIVPPVKRLMPKFERYEPEVLDASSMRYWKKCPRYYFLTIVLGFKERGTSYPLVFGSAYHKFREVLTKTGKLQDALAAATKDWPGDPVVGTRYDFLTQARLVKSCMVAYASWSQERTKNRITVISPEQGFGFELTGSKYKRGGRIDEMLRFAGKPWIRDFKSTSKNKSYYERLLEPNDQFMGYSWGANHLSGEPVQGVLVELLYNTRKEGPKIIPLSTTRTTNQIADWEQDQIATAENITKARESDRWPKHEPACPFCPFRSVCKSSSESAQVARLEASFDQKPWDFMANERSHEG